MNTITATIPSNITVKYIPRGRYYEVTDGVYTKWVACVYPCEEHEVYDEYDNIITIKAMSQEESDIEFNSMLRYAIRTVEYGRTN